MTNFNSIRLIINPAAGHQEPILNTLNTAFQDQNIKWSVAVTLADGDGQRFAEEAVADGVELVVAYGGDGTVKDVANGLIDSDVPLGILHGGTGNAMAYKLNIPTDLAKAAQLLLKNHELQPLDIGKLECEGGTATGHFVLRSSIGMQNDVLQHATSDLKSRFGNMAYVMAVFDTFSQADEIDYHITVDDQETQTVSGLTCMVANAATIGGTANFDFAPQVSPSDGMLNTFVFAYENNTLLDVLKSHLDQDLSAFPRHFAGRKIHIDTESPQSITIDGESLGTTPASIEVLPAAVHVVVPATKQSTS